MSFCTASRVVPRAGAVERAMRRAHGQIRVDEKVGVVIAMRVRTRSKARYIQRHFPAALVPDLQMSAFDVTKKNSAGAPLLSHHHAPESTARWQGQTGETLSLTLRCVDSAPIRKSAMVARGLRAGRSALHVRPPRRDGCTCAHASTAAVSLQGRTQSAQSALHPQAPKHTHTRARL